MDSTLHDLGGLLLKGIPTILLLIVLNLYLKRMFFRPLEAVLERRRAMTEGARQAAEELLDKASAKTAEYEAKLRDAREQIYRDQEETRRRWIDEQTKRVEEARHKAHELIQQAREQIEAETETAKRDLASENEVLAGQIAESLLRRRPA